MAIPIIYDLFPKNGKVSLLGLKQIWVFESSKSSYFRALKFGKWNHLEDNSAVFLSAKIKE